VRTSFGGRTSPANSVHCLFSDVRFDLRYSAARLPAHGASGLPQQFLRMYVPSMLAVGPFRPELSVLLIVWATVKASM